MQRREVALFGGSFNPPHVGHALAVAYVASVHEIDALVVPVHRHAFGKQLAPFADRLEMCRLAMGWLGARISDIERDIGGESRTLHTIEALREREPELRPRLLIGSDVLADLPKWHRFDRIDALAPPIVLGRAGHPHPDAPEAVLPEVSSTAIREAAARGALERVAALLPRAVRDYIEERELYR